MSALDTKIQSYSPEVNIEFDTAYSTTPPNTGSISLVAWTQNNTLPVASSTGGPTNGSGYWTIANATRFRNSTTALGSALLDHNYVVGFWFRCPVLPTGSLQAARPLVSVVTTSNAIGFDIVVSGTGFTSTAAPSKLHLRAATNYEPFGATLVANTWYYVAVVRENQTGTGNYKVYLNGALALTTTNTGTSGFSSVTVGSVTSSAGESFDISNLHIGTTANFTSTAIAEIYTAGAGSPSTNYNFNASAATASATAPDSTNSAGVNNVETPATASAEQIDPLIVSTSSTIQANFATASGLFVNPTVVIIDANNTEIWTSVNVDALMVNPSSVIASQNLSIASDILTASAEFDNHIGIGGSDILQQIEPMIATANSVNPSFYGTPDFTVSVAPMLITNATIPGYSLYIPPSYDTEILGDGPILFINQDTTSPVNKGTGNFGIPTFGAGWSLQASGTPMNQNGEGTSWYADQDDVADQSIIWSDAGSKTALYNMHLTNNWTYEYWFKPTEHTWDNGATTPTYFTIDNGYFALNTIENGSNFSPTNINMVLILRDDVTVSASSSYTLFGVPTLNQWHHIVVTSKQETNGTVTFSFWKDGTIVRSVNYSPGGPGFTPNPTKVNAINSTGLQFFPQGKVTPSGYWDQIAIYNRTLTNAEIASHYEFIINNDGSRVVGAEYAVADAEMGNHTTYIVINNNYPATTVIASSIIVNPTILTSTNINISATSITASTNVVNPLIVAQLNLTINVFPFIASANMPGGFHQDTTFAVYVETLSPAPWRYHNLDNAADWISGYPQNTTNSGTDNSYTFNMFSVGTGNHTQAVSVINNYSVFSELDYAVDTYARSLTFYESEYNDDWGSVFSNNGDGWTTSFCLRSHPFHSVNAGLVPLFEIYSYIGQDHLFLYHLNNKLMVEIRDNNNYISYESPLNVNLFDLNRHQITITYHRDGTNSHPLVVYVDGVAVISENTGTINPTFRQSVYVQGPNVTNWEKACLGGIISAKLNHNYFLQNPNVIPQETQLYFDEFIWLKWDMNATEVLNLYNALPPQGDKFIAASPITASALLVQPQTSLGVTKEGSALQAVNGIIQQPTIYTEFGNIINAIMLDASALFVEPFAVTVNVSHVTINSDVMVASADINSAVVLITLRGETMYATVAAVNAQPYFDEYLLLIMMQTHTTQGAVTTFGGRWGIGDHDA